jgi:N-acetylglucosaminyl-diphospho-decaprenol L-rhamnosyltransferase
MSARIDVVVVSYNNGDTLRACVAPLVAAPGVAVTVVDNGSADGTLASIADLPVRAIASGRNGGFGFGCNIGTATGAAPYVLLLNPDARIDPADVTRLAAELDAEPGVAIVGPQLLEDDGTLIPSQRRFQRIGSLWAQAFYVHRLLPRARWADEVVKEQAAYERAGDPEWLSGACLLVRRSVLAELGGFDEGFFLYCEDQDLCFRARAAGHGVRYVPDATAQHEGGHSAPRANLYAVLARSRMRFARKHAGGVSVLLQHAGLVVGALTHIAGAVGRPAHARGHAAALRATLGRRSPLEAA